MHIALPIGPNTLMGNYAPIFMGLVNENEKISKIAVSAASREEADKLLNGLSAGGTVEIRLADSAEGVLTLQCLETNMG